MIIHRIHANNVLKYTSLRLDDLPERGLIAITGPNESGKSSIGETLCFALFGRTFSLDYDNLGKVIHWGETHCSVEVEFTASDGDRYTLERFLDDSGNHSARISRPGQAREAQPLARGIDKVADLVYELIGYEYEEFIESFYLAQREITTPHPHSYAVKTMAGLVTLEYSSAAFQEEVEETGNSLAETRKEIASLANQVEEVELEPGRLQGLQSEQAELTTRQARYNRQLSLLDSASIDYQDALPKRESALKARTLAGFFRFISLLLALVAGGAWVLLSKLPAHAYAGDLSHLLTTNIPAWQDEMIPWLLYGAIGFTLLFVLFWVRAISQNSQARQLLKTGKDLASVLDDLEPVETLQAAAAIPEDSEERADAEEAGEAAEHAAEPTVELIDRAARERLSQRVADFQADFAQVREGVGMEQNLLRDAMNATRERSGQLDEAISQEQARIARVEGLLGMQDDMEKRNAERQHHLDQCILAGELIQGAMREVSYQFNHKVRDLVSKTLPLFTENRYEHLQIDDDLTVRAFSSEKRDFMDLEEISSGTQRQIMLAVRLALSQELVGRAVKASQFLFLDEPFAFFDQARTRSSLTVLPSLSEQLNQIWIIGQEFPSGLKFDHHITCNREYQSIPPVEV